MRISFFFADSSPWKCCLTFFMLALQLHGFSQGPVLKGTISEHDKPMPGVTVYLEQLNIGTLSDSLGKYSISVPSGTYWTKFSFTGYKTVRVKLTLHQPQRFDVVMEEDITQLDEMVVNAQAEDHNVASVDMGVSTLTMKTLSKMPAFIGEVDIIKSMLLLPGVTTVGEGTSGINVRGGNSDQYLILLDGMPIFNPSHLMGMFSVFNPDMAKDISLYRGGVPAQFGGRASSVLDISVRSPSTKRSFQGGIGLVANRFLFETPIIKDRLSLIIGTRFSFSDYLFKVLKSSSLRNTKANFYDITGRVEYLKGNDRIYLTAYNSTDVFKLPSDSISTGNIPPATDYRWKSNTATLGWIHKFASNLSLKSALVYSKYNSVISSHEVPNDYDFKSDITYKSIKSDLSWQKNAHQAIGGIELSQYKVNPGTLTPLSDQTDLSLPPLQSEQGTEMAVFGSDEVRLQRWLTMQAGLRYSYYFNTGPSTVYAYAPGSERDIKYITDTIQYAKHERIASYGGLEPRLAFNLRLGVRSSVKIGYSRLRQYLQRVTNTTASLPTDRWQLSNTYIKPIISDQFSVGYFRNFSQNKYEASVEVYTKNIQNISDYKGGADLLLTPLPETVILQGKGKAYGLEFQIKKNVGRLTGWLNYTYSQTMILIQSTNPDEQVNNGKWYPANYNRPHSLNLVLNYSPNKKGITYAANFTFSSGRPTTYAYNRYYMGFLQVSNFIDRNQDVIPNYHRLDLSMTIDPMRAANKRFHGSWVFSLYNVYARKNAFSVFTKTNGIQSAIISSDAYKLSIFATIIPSITYNFKF